MGLQRSHTPQHKTLWALKPDAKDYSFVGTVHDDKEKTAEYKKTFLEYYPDSTFKIQRTKPTIN
jgi:hypothetical protein